jgi:hypothetical protein
MQHGRPDCRRIQSRYKNDKGAMKMKALSYLTVREIREEIKKAKKVFVKIDLSDLFGGFMQVTKKEILRYFSPYSEEAIIDIVIRSLNNNQHLYFG